MPHSLPNDHLTAQARFLEWLEAASAMAPESALKLWCQVNAFINGKPSLARIQVATLAAASPDSSYNEVERGVAPYVRDLVAPALGAFITSQVLLALGVGALLTAVITLVVFCVLLFRQGGSLDRIREWMDKKLESLRSFAP
ncbi:hypothetical protein [Roseomonas sp. AR75]|uniref:hypothetical protein n=1 Tax=Roseomonas sp. AR75 TaxID=2562311 RepID=UPI0010C149B5|nr:hypothetical protein [Roseomonas sp. AR75]